MFLENSLLQMFLNMFVDKILSTGIQFIKFHLQWLFILDFRWTEKVIKLFERYTIMKCVRTGPRDNLLRPQRWAQG